MRSFPLPRLFRVAFLGLVLAALCLASLLPKTAQAAIVGCRADPVVVLSDGTIIDVTVDIGTNVENVTHIHYRIHGPKQAWLIKSISTPTIGFTGRETFEYINDAPQGRYITEAIVQTRTNNVSVTAYTTFASAITSGALSRALAYQTATGLNGDILRVMLMR